MTAAAQPRDGKPRRSPTVIIDDAGNGGSPAGSWATAIAHIPHLAAQLAAQEAEHV